MMETDFSRFSLVLTKDEKIVFSSEQQGLRPLAEAVSQFKGKLQGCTLHDKVVGLAAARLIIYSGMISEVITPLMSMQAKALLEETGMPLKAEAVVKNIMNKDRSDVCPMEKKAQEIQDNKEFAEELFKKLNIVDNTI
jgi:hypothetical protein